MNCGAEKKEKIHQWLMSVIMEPLLRITEVGYDSHIHILAFSAIALTVVWFRSWFVRDAELLATGIARRTKFPAAHGRHPKPSLGWIVSENLKFETGFVDVHGSSIWWQSFRHSDKVPRGIIVMYHGYGDHSDYILHEQAHELAKYSDFIVVAFDQPGFGRSDGLWAYIADWDRHVQTCMAATKMILRDLVGSNNKLPVFGYGHSMGGGICVSASVLEPSFFRGLVLSAPMLGIAKSLRHNKYVEQFFMWLADRFPTLPMAPVPDLGPLCFEDPQFYQRVRETNHLNYPGHVRLGTAKSLLIAQNSIGNNMEKVSVPFLLLHGDTDKVTALEGSERLFKLAASSDKRIEVLRGYYHSLWGPGVEKSRTEHVRNEIIHWLTDRCQ